jgi:hypothetical protein
MVFGIVFALQFGMIYGGIAALEHVLLRWYLWRAGVMPWNYVAFLNYASDRILLRKVGGGYMFAHLLLRDYFVELDAQTIAGEEPGEEFAPAQGSRTSGLKEHAGMTIS